MKICVLTNILAPYRIGLFERIARKVGRLTVVTMASGHSNRHWELPDSNLEVVVLPGAHVRLPWNDEPYHFNTSVWKTLRRIDPDVVISGGFTAANVAAYLYCRVHRRRYVSWGELTLHDGAQRSFIRRFLRRRLISGSDANIASSSVARDAFEHYGAARSRVLLSVMPVDVDWYRDTATAFRASPAFGSLGIKYSRPVLLSIGRLVDVKGYDELFDIYAGLVELHPLASLLIAGEGAKRAEYEARVRERGWRNVHFLGYLQPPDIVALLGIADVFVFHTRFDPFGAVLSEAMAAGTISVTSQHAAATRDLVQDGVSGFVIDPKNTADSVRAIDTALRLTGAERSAMRRAAYTAVKRWDFDTAAADIVSMLERV